ncbi:MAG: sigma-70 family RNA polymerase sigma factor [Verrucomicrobiales bacterium]|nr:sigma-70 family RNA polymerase sigma factor [Verrucomicrobiales bacterium]
MPEESLQNPVPDPPIDFDRGESFTRLLLETQPRLFGFTLSLLHDRQAAMDVTQDVGVLLWRKFDEYEPGTDFGAWALKIARFKVMEWRRAQTKLPIALDDDAMELLTDDVEELSSAQLQRLAALETCLSRLPEKQRQVIDERYVDKNTVVRIAERWNRSRVAMHQLLKKAHQTLRLCVQEQLRKEGQSPS